MASDKWNEILNSAGTSFTWLNTINDGPSPIICPNDTHGEMDLTSELDSVFVKLQKNIKLLQNRISWVDSINRKLSFGDDKMAWGAGLATGTAGTFALLFLGPIAGYYAGKAVHKRTVVEKVKERLLEDGKMSNVLRRWNEQAWAKRGFHTLLELPEEEGNVRNRADAKRFRIVVIPGSVVIRQFPMSPQIDTTVQMELQGERLFQRREVSLQRPTQQLPSHHQPPPIPARVPSIQNLPGNPLYEMPITQAPTVSKFPYTQAGTGEFVHYYEMDGESVRR